MKHTVEEFARLVETAETARFRRDYPTLEPPKVTIKPGRRWTKVDVDRSGKYVVDTNGAIFGIKAYGVPHFGHYYGTLDTIHEGGKPWNSGT